MTPRAKCAQADGRARWLASAEFQTTWRENLAKAWEVQRTAPRCGAKTKRSGEPCRKLALDNGRCRYHGGRTPKGKDWHKVQLANAQHSVAAMVRKEKDVSRRRAKQAARVAAMTDEERARYEAWQRTHKPGSAAARQSARESRKTAAWLSGLLGERQSQEAHSVGAVRVPEASTRDPSAIDEASEAQRIAAAIQRLDARLAELQRAKDGAEQKGRPDDDEP